MKKINPIPFKGMLSMSRTAIMATLVMLVTSFTLQAQTNWYVNDATAENGWSVGNNANAGNSISAPKATIQAAITSAAPGDIINVGTGTFTNNFSVTKSLSIRGMNYQQSGPTRGPTAAANESIISGGRALISINANNVSIDGFRIVPTSSRLIENPIGTGLSITNNVIIVNGSRSSTLGIFDARMNNISGVNISDNLFQCTSGTGGFVPIYFVRSSGSLVLDNATFINNSFVNTAHGIYLDKKVNGSSNNVSILGNTFSNIQGVSTASTGGGRAIMANELSNSTISGNTFDNVYYFGLQLGAANSVSVMNNNFIGSSINGVRVVSSMNNVGVHENNFSANFSQKAIINEVASGTLIATCNWLGSNNAGDVANSVSALNGGTINYTPWLINNTDLDANAVGFQTDNNACTGGSVTAMTIDNIYADDIYCEETGSVEITFSGGVAPYTVSWPGGSESNVISPFVIPALPPGTHTITITDANSTVVSGNATLVAKKVYNASWGIAYSSLQAAIDAASPGDVITLCSGTYNEKISIGKTLTILGPNANISPNTVGVPSSSNPSRYEEAIIMPNETSGALLTVTASSISLVIKGVVFDRGNGTANTARFIDQINKTGISWVLENNIFQNAPSTQNGYFYLTGTVTGMSFDFNNNRLVNNGVSNGIALWGTSVTNVNINNNVWYNNSAWSFNANSIVGTVNNNYFVDGRPGAVDSVWSKVQNGFIVANDNNNLTVNGNVFNNLHSGINIYRGDANANNHFRGTMAISNNTFQQMHNYAIRGSKGAYSPDLTNVTIQNNSFINAKLLNDTNAFVMNATCNWFGSLNAQTIASGISGNVSYSPWLVNGTDDQPTTMGFQPVSASCTGTAPVISGIISNPELCDNVIGSLAVSFSSGTAPYSITLNNNTPFASVTSPYSFTNLANGTYTVTITDANNSTVTSTATVGFQPVYVKNSSNTLTGYNTISLAIAGASNGDTLFVCPGTYTEDIVINKPLTVRGANYGVSPNTGTRSTETILVPSATNTSTGAVVTITSSGVTFDGFSVDGDNTTLPSSGVGLGDTLGTSIDAARAIFVNGNGLTNVNIINNIASNAVNGIRVEQTTNYFASGAAAQFATGNLINDNKVQNMTGTGIRLGNSFFAKVTNNTVTNADNGIAFSSFRTKDNGNAADRVISNNTISARYAGIWVNLFHASPYTLSNNTITPAPSATSMAPTPQSRTAWFGIMYSTVSCPQNFTSQTNLPLVATPEYWVSSGNKINATSLEEASTGYGYWLYHVDNNRDNLSVDHYGQISGDTVSGVDVGIMMKNKDTDVATNFGTAAVGAHASLSDVTFNLATGGTAIKLIDDATWTTSNPAPLINKRDVKLNLGNNVVINNGAIGIDISHPASGTTAYTAYSSIPSGLLNNTAFVGQTGNYIQLSNHPNNLDATSATFESNTGANASIAQNWDIENKISHKVDATTRGFVRVRSNHVFVAGGGSGSIQRGIDIASASENVYVGPGTYTGNVLVNKALSLYGANYGVAGNGTRSTEAKIQDAQLTVSGTSAILVDGFDFYQTTANYNGTISLTTGNTPVTIQNNIIERWAVDSGSVVRGIETSNTIAAISITNNLFRGDNSANLYGKHLSWNSAIYSNGGNISITNNEFASCRTAINSDNTSATVVMNNNIFGINGTAISFGGTTATEGSYTLSGNSFNTPNTVLNLSNVNTNYRVDATSNTFNGVPAADLTLAQAFALENQLYHKGRGGNKNGLVRIKAGNMFNTTTTTIANNVLYSDAGDTLHINDGSYDGALTIDKKLNIIGQGNNTVIRSSANTAITYSSTASGSSSSDRAYLQNVRIASSNKGILASQLVNHLTLNNVAIDSSTTYGIHLNNTSGVMNDWVLNGCSFDANGSGYYGATASNINGISFNNCTFTNQTNSGIYVGQSSSTPGGMNNVTITGCSFANNGVASNNQAAMYIEKLSNATISNNSITNNGLSGTNPRGIILNLKYASFNNITIIGNTVEENRSTPTNGYGIQIAARNDAPSYNSLPASLSGLNVSQNNISGHVRGLTIDNNVDWNTVSIQENKISNCRYGFLTTVYGTGNTANASATMQINNNSISNVDTTIINYNLNGGTINATCNWLGVVNQQDIASKIVGDVTYSPWLVSGTDDNPIAVGFQQTNPTCIGASLSITQNSLDTVIFCKDEGSAYVDLEINGGVTPYTISLNGVSFVTSDTTYVNDTIGTSGLYTLVVTDSIGSTATLSFTVVEPSDSLKVTATPEHPKCASDQGAIVLNATGGTSPISVDIIGEGSFGPTQTAPVDPGNTYTIVATDNNGCTVETEVTIDAAPDALVWDPTTSKTDALCAGLDGELVFLANGGTGTISYTVDGVSAISPKFATAATYTIAATDENNCSIDTTLIINQPLGISIVVSNLDNPKCFEEDGSFNLRGVGGTAIDSTGFTYAVNGDNYDFSDKYYGPDGTYTITVTDAVNSVCSVSTVVTLTQPALLEVNTTITNVACFGDDGLLAYTVSGGTAPYSIDINNLGYSEASQSLPNPAGTYTISVIDANGCTIDPVEVDITQPVSALEFTSTNSISPDCFGQAGSIEFLAEGGTGNIEYRIDNVVVNSPFTGLAGTYTVTATDENGCSTTTDILLLAPTKVVFDNVTLTNLTCFEDASGAIAFTASGGTGGVNFNVNGSFDVSPSLNKPAGVYTITAIDDNQCSVDSIVTLTEPSIIQITSDVTNALCNGGDGSVSISAIGGTGSKSFTVNGNTNNGSFTGAAGIYTVEATDASSCTITKTFTITEPSTSVAFISNTATAASCFGENGILTYGANGGTGTITYKVNGVSQESPFNTLAGNYTITATDGNGCTATTTLEITEPAAAFTLTASKTDALCNGVDGLLTFSGDGGTLPYSFTVNLVGQNSPFNAPTGTYNVIGTDANGCSSSATLTIGQPDAVTFTTASKLDASCNNSNGSLTFEATGGTGTITYKVNNTVGATSPYSAAAGNYTVIASDANSCSVETTFVVAAPSAVVLTASNTNAPCKNGEGTLTFSASGGAGTYTFTVNSASQTSPFDTVAGSYTIVATDANNCSASTVLEITEPNLLEINASADDALCNGADGKLTFSATGGTTPYTFKYGNDTINSPYSTLAGSYTVTVIDANGCSASNSTLTIGQPTALSFGTASVTNVLCNGGDGQLEYLASGGTSTINYTVNGTTATSPFVAVAGSYTVTATDVNNCTVSTVMTVTQPDLVVLTASKTDALCKSENGSLTFSATGGSGNLNYTVNGNATTSTINVAAGAGTYTIAVTDANNCSKDTVISVSEPDLLTLTTNVTNADCYGANGTITFSANGGTTNYTFKVNGTTTTSPYSSAVAGSYTISVTDANNCSTSTEVVVTQPNLITTSESASACYSYTWPVNNTTYTVTGTYSDTLTSQNGCDSVVNLNLTITPYSFDTATVVSYLTYTWRNNTYTVSGTYVDTAGINGSPACTVYVLNLTITTCIEPILGTPTPAQQGATITWTMPAGASSPSYGVQIAPAGTNNWSTLQTTSNLSFNFTGLTSNTAYSYRVRALCGINSVSEWVTGSFTTNVIVCSTPTFNTTTVGLTTATVSWSNTGAGQYILAWKPQSSSTWSTATITGTTQTRNLTGLTSGTTYDIRVTGLCLSEVYSDTAVATFTTTAPCGNITYTSNTPARNSIRVDWSSVPGAVNYTTARSNGSGGWTAISTITNLNRTFTGLTANTTYTIRVRAVCANNVAGAYNEIVLTTSAAKTAEEMLTANIVNFNGEVTAEGNNLIWSTANENNCQEMVLQHSTNGSNYSDIARIHSLADGGTSDEELNYSYLHKDAPFGVNYYRLKSINFDGDRAYHKDIVTLTKEVPSANVRIYPNPTKDLLNLDFNAAQQGQVRVKILDMTGRVVKVVQVQVSQGENSVGVGIGEFPQGIYTIQMSQDNQLLHVSKIYRKD